MPPARTKLSSARVAAGLLLLVLASAPGCARREQLGVPGANERGAARSVFTLGWTHRVMPGIAPYRDRSNPIQGSVPELDVEGRRIFVGSADEHLYCLRADTGEVLWRQETGAAIRSRPLFQQSTQVVFFGTDNGELWAVGAADGERRWVFEAEGEIVHQPVIQGEALYFASADNTVFALDWTNGEQIWRQHHEGANAEFQVTGFAGVAVDNRVVFTGFSDGTVAAFDAVDGNEVWARNLAENVVTETRRSGIPVMPDVDTTPVLGQRRVYAASYEAGVFALDRISGAVVWREPVKGVVHLFGQGDRLYASQAGEGVVALDTARGRLLWRRALGSATYYRSTAFRDLLVVPDSRHGLSALRLDDGAVVQRYAVGGGLGGGVSLFGRRAFVLSNGGVLAAISMR